MSDQAVERERLAQDRLPAIERERDELRASLKRAEQARDRYAHILLEGTRVSAYALVEFDLKVRKVTKLTIGEHVICAERSGLPDGTVERCPCPTLLMAVDGLGVAEDVIVLSEKDPAGGTDV